MKKIVLLLVLLVIITLFTAFREKEQKEWIMDKSHSRLGFSVTHMLVSDVDGWFRVFDAKIISTGDDFSGASAEMTAEVNSINTEVEKRDTHLKSADFFDAAKYPQITFKSKTFKKTGPNTYKVTGDLTMHGITKTIDLDVTCRMGTHPSSKKPIAGFKVTGLIKRNDFGIGASSPEAVVSNDVTLIANAEFSAK